MEEKAAKTSDDESLEQGAPENESAEQTDKAVQTGSRDTNLQSDVSEVESDFITFDDLMELLPQVKFDILIVSIPVKRRAWSMAEDVIVKRFRYVSCKTAAGEHSIVPSTHEDVVRHCQLQCIENVSCR